MKIKGKLTLWFTLLVATILLVFVVVVYWSSSKNREVEFFEVLEKEGITKAKLFFEAKVNPSTLHKIYRFNSEVINEVEVAIYDLDFKLLYHDAEEIDRVKETKSMIDKIISQKRVHYFQDDWQVIGMVYSYNGKDYVLTATALDEYGYVKMHNLFLTITLLTIVSLIVIYICGGLFADRVLLPIKVMNKEVNNITATNLDLRISTEKNRDELGALANNFNVMLDRLEQSFDAQKQFVSNISHELRTPLAAIIAELELALVKEQEVDAYVKTIENALADSKKIVRLSNSLLDFAKASYDPTEIVFKSVRMDEVVLDACQKLQKSNPTYKFNFVIDEKIDSEEMVSIKGNSYLLEVAIMNLLENACKFSKDQQCKISISNTENKLRIIVADEGIGMSREDLDNLFTPFYRGENGKLIDGNGIGLSLTHKIIRLHQGTIDVQSQVNKGTIFTVTI
ncbi:sensor histidine kinase [Myroides phaeus]|uniref:HAMP domain-containing sensor histidine kinase n=1 Tax=Myroides phaeus TaxID=702745 RepID=UPI0013033EE9|nr:HAMP domain-containing sensor histidine kinase [Myroides phaeus]